MLSNLGGLISRQNSITYPLVAEACAALIQEGDRPSIRKIHQKVGGSYSTLSVLYHRWQEEQTLAHKGDTDLSDVFRQAALAEIRKATAALEQRLSKQLNTEKASLKEAQSLLAEYESQIQQLHEELTTIKKTAEHKHLNLERALAVSKAQVEDSAKREASCQHQVDTLRQAVHQAEL